jgi:hypothetical protein
VADFGEQRIAWRKSTASNSGGCVEVAVIGGSVLVRDSKNRTGPVLRLSPTDWSALLARARTGLAARRRV